VVPMISDGYKRKASDSQYTNYIEASVCVADAGQNSSKGGTGVGRSSRLPGMLHTGGWHPQQDLSRIWSACAVATRVKRVQSEKCMVVDEWAVGVPFSARMRAK
jgi:hypothetical protein